MATTDARAGFRLPWSTERSNSDQTETDQLNATEIAESATDAAEGNVATDSPDGVAPAPEDPKSAPAAETEAEQATETPHASSESATTGAPQTPAKKPSKFLADLTKAMQVAAEEARSRVLTQFQADAKSHVEQIHARSAEEATDLRRKADDDVASVREWSKAEIARIREETEGKISARKSRLEGEIEEHAGLIEREIERVQSRVGAFEAEMATFFERLLADDDPTHFATMAENLPEPPTFDSSDLLGLIGTSDVDGAVETEAVVETETAETSETDAGGSESTGSAEASSETAEASVADDATDESTSSAEADATETSDSSGSDDGAGENGLDREAAYAAIQAAAEAAASAEIATDAADRAEAVAGSATETAGAPDAESEGEPEDPRVAALALSPDFDAAEAEAAASADAGSVEEIPEIGDDALAARLAGLVPGKAEGSAPAQDAKTTQVIVVGLVSVASIASFKRHLGRLSGVQSVGVSSGPDGEFIFTVHHGADVVLRDLLPGLPSFQARVTAQSDGTLNVTAHDPESDN